MLVRPFQSVILLEGTRITLSCFPTLFPEEVPLNWTNNGMMINEDTSGITFSPKGLNHNLTIESPTAADSGVYRCIAAPTVNQTINVTVLESKKLYKYYYALLMYYVYYVRMRNQKYFYLSCCVLQLVRQTLLEDCCGLQVAVVV